MPNIYTPGILSCMPVVYCRYTTGDLCSRTAKKFQYRSDLRLTLRTAEGRSRSSLRLGSACSGGAGALSWMGRWMLVFRCSLGQRRAQPCRVRIVVQTFCSLYLLSAVQLTQGSSFPAVFSEFHLPVTGRSLRAGAQLHELVVKGAVRIDLFVWISE